ncbi:MAG: zinc-dependent alcohol dehydrogenase family protein [Spirochaetales bacterium]
MKALVLQEAKKLEVTEINLPELKPNEVLIKVMAAGVCGTDLHLYEGEEGATASTLPLILGHEFSGIIEKLGNDVADYACGDRVCVDPNLYCGECDNCKCGNVQYCTHAQAYGVTRFGGFAQYCIVNTKVLYKIPDSLSYEGAALVEMIACCLHGIDRTDIQIGDTVAIIGFGSVGQAMFQLSKLSGVAKVIVIEPNEEKRKLAIKMGAYLCVDPVNENACDKIAHSRIRSVDKVIECSGNIHAMHSALEIASKGATVMLFGLSAPQSKLTVLPFEQVFRKELIITSSFVNPLCTQRVIDMLENKVLDIESIITDKIALKDSISVFTDSHYRTRGKIIILPNA